MFALYYEEDDRRLIWIAGCHDIRSALGDKAVAKRINGRGCYCAARDDFGVRLTAPVQSNDGQEIQSVAVFGRRLYKLFCSSFSDGAVAGLIARDGLIEGHRDQSAAIPACEGICSACRRA